MMFSNIDLINATFEYQIRYSVARFAAVLGLYILETLTSVSKYVANLS